MASDVQVNRRGFLAAAAGLAVLPTAAPAPAGCPCPYCVPLELETRTLYVKREPFRIEFFAYETVGFAMGKPLSRASFE